ncbi:MAG: LuxE/PaaK family acyltransferase [Chitinophagaceae bacterium]
MGCQWKDKILAVKETGFENLALEIFRFQYENNTVYQQYVNALQVPAERVQSLDQIPFLPIRFFKSHRVSTTSFDATAIFESSGTTGGINSRHFVKDVELYRASCMQGFELFYGPVNEWCIIGLLPSYLERQNSSLVYMVNEFIRQSDNTNSGFYLNEFEQLFNLLKQLSDEKQKTLLIGVTFGLLDFAEAYSSRFYQQLFNHTVIMETGGMKGRRKEMIRQEVHAILKNSFHVPAIHSEYGMTELLSQAYSGGDGIFKCPPWMKVLVRDEEDPLTIKRREAGRFISGAINIIDLANIFSCSFIATDDAGKVFPDDSFEVLGRIDNSDLRGCSLMVV